MDSASTTLSSRMHASIWIAVLIFGGLGALFPVVMYHSRLQPLKASDVVGIWTMASLVLVPALLLAICALRAQILMDATGVRVRILGNWKRVRWEEVSDYYLQQSSKGSSMAVLVTTKGKILLSSGWTRKRELKARVVQEAIYTPVRGWGERGKREKEVWPIVLQYNSFEQRFRFCIVGFSLLFGIGFFFGLILPKTIKTINEMGWGWGLGTGLMGSFPILTLCLLALIHVPDIKELRRRRHQRITVHEQGLLYEEGERRLSVPWAEVTSCQIVKSRGVSSSTTYVVTTSQGTFDFNSHLQESRLPESRLLYRLIERYAPSSIDLVQNDEACLDELPTRIPTNSGEQIFHYRSRESRAVLWFYSAFLIILLLLPALLAHFGFGPVHPEQSRGDSLFQQSLSIALPAGWLWCYWRYRSARIVIDDSGITQFGPFGRTTLAWNEIHSYRKRDSTYTVSGYHRKLRFFSMIVRVAVLQEEIRKRATGSSNQDWETKDTDSD